MIIAVLGTTILLHALLFVLTVPVCGNVSGGHHFLGLSLFVRNWYIVCIHVQGQVSWIITDMSDIFARADHG